MEIEMTHRDKRRLKYGLLFTEIFLIAIVGFWGVPNIVMDVLQDWEVSVLRDELLVQVGKEINYLNYQDDGVTPVDYSTFLSRKKELIIKYQTRLSEIQVVDSQDQRCEIYKHIIDMLNNYEPERFKDVQIVNAI